MTKLAVNICAAAPHCMSEALELRKGTNWVSVSSLPAQDIDQRMLSMKEKCKGCHQFILRMLLLDLEKVVLQILERFLACGDTDSANPSALNPVLGLMGKII
uniref:Uncharacterized protein n=1 Tax=Salix viminalis TaxID=40686 RepID=A0A6N2KYC2_SALVM